MSKPKFVIVFVGQLQACIDAAVFIPTHLSRTGISDFSLIQLQPRTTLQCGVATEGASIKPGHILFASPKLRLLIKRESIILDSYPQENRWRPSITVLFRSAAAAYSTIAGAVVLSGNWMTAGMIRLYIKVEGTHAFKTLERFFKPKLRAYHKKTHACS